MKQFIFYFTLILVSGCIAAPDFPNEPVLTYTGLSKNIMNQGSVGIDSVIVFFNFTDGDGDLGQEVLIPGNFDLIITDLRTGNILDNFFAPFVPPKGASNGIKGSAEVLVYTTCCIFKDSPPCSVVDSVPVNQLILEISLRDRAGNKSNNIQTDPIQLICN